MADLIDRQSAIETLNKLARDNFTLATAFSFYLGALHDAADDIKQLPSTDAVEVVRCKDCKHRWVNEHYGEKGYMKIKAMCSLDTDDPFEFGRNAYDDDWFCADGERKDE